MPERRCATHCCNWRREILMPPFFSSSGSGSNAVGRWKLASLSCDQASSVASDSVGSPSITATGRWPNSASTTGTTNACVICGCAASTRSISSGCTPSPPLKNRLSNRPRIRSSPRPSRRDRGSQTSPVHRPAAADAHDASSRAPLSARIQTSSSTSLISRPPSGRPTPGRASARLAHTVEASSVKP